VILTPGRVLQVQTDDLAEPITSTMVTTLTTTVREHILRVLREAGGVIGGKHGAALRLGVKRTTLMSKMRKLGISHREVDEQPALLSKS
jgi:formate hydrogenlyase transcriptional activator